MSRKTRSNRQPAYYLLTLGCPKNTVDSEGMAMLLQGDGYRSTASPDAADILIVNTCGFLESAKDESLATLRHLARGKRPGQKLVAAGCLAQRNGDEIVRHVPGAELVVIPDSGHMVMLEKYPEVNQHLRELVARVRTNLRAEAQEPA